MPHKRIIVSVHLSEVLRYLLNLKAMREARFENKEDRPPLSKFPITAYRATGEPEQYTMDIFDKILHN